MKKYMITFTEAQLKAISEACEFYSRYVAGQCHQIPDSVAYKLLELEKREFKGQNLVGQARDCADYLKLKLFPELHKNESYGVGCKIRLDEHSSKIKDILYDIYRPILELFSKGNSASVYSHEGHSYSKEGRIKIEEVK